MRVIIKEEGYEYKIEEAPIISSPAIAVKHSGDIKDSITEVFVVMYLNAKNGLMSSEIISMGMLDSALVHPREVYRSAILKNAASIIILHNHPSGNENPSSADITTTKRLIIVTSVNQAKGKMTHVEDDCWIVIFCI